jgi:hypothetical protein
VKRHGNLRHLKTAGRVKQVKIAWHVGASGSPSATWEAWNWMGSVAGIGRWLRLALVNRGGVWDE